MMLIKYVIHFVMKKKRNTFNKTAALKTRQILPMGAFTPFVPPLMCHCSVDIY